MLVVGFHDDVNPIILQNVPLKARITSVNNITTKNKEVAEVKNACEVAGI